MLCSTFNVFYLSVIGNNILLQQAIENKVYGVKKEIKKNISSYIEVKCVLRRFIKFISKIFHYKLIGALCLKCISFI